MTSWDNNNFSTRLNPSTSMHDAAPLSVSSNNYLVPIGQHSPPNYLQHNVNERQIQRYAPRGAAASKPVGIHNVEQSPSKPKSLTDKITISHTIGFLGGLILLGIPLCVMITVYALFSSNSSGSTTVSSTISTAVFLPAQCTNYIPNSDSSRFYTYPGCCTTTDASYTGWYRFTGAAGSQLVTYPQNINYCYSNAPGWWNGTHPTTVGATAIGTLCANFGGSICNPSYSPGPVLATNCSGYYVYYLQSLYCCNPYPRYCTM